MRSRFSWISRRSALAGIALASSAWVGCAQPTELVVVVDAEPRLEVTRVVVDVFGSGAGQRAEAAIGPGASSLPVSLGIVPRRDGVSRVTVQIVATVVVNGLDATLSRVVRTSFHQGSSRMIRVVLGAACVGHTCPDGQSCELGGCLPIDVDPASLPEWPGAPPPRPEPEQCAARSELCNGFDDDCDGRVDEGIDIVTSTANCGACGRTCASGSCESGLCAEDRVVAIAAGGAHTCALRASSAVTCWGANHERQAADTRDFVRSRPTTQAGLGFEAVATGVDHTCALTVEGTVACVGNGSTGALGTGFGDQSRFTDALVPTMGAATAIATGAGLSAAIVNGRIVVWGTFAGTSLPTPMELNHPQLFISVAVGTRHLCGILSNGRVACTGANDRGQLGRGDRLPHPVGLVEVPDLETVRHISTGRDVTCALRMDGTVLCWGANDVGQLGSDGPDQPSPVVVPGLGAAISVDVARAGAHACAVLQDGSVACWGDNSSAALGDGTTMPRRGIVRVSGIRGAVEVAAGGLGIGSGFSCARLVSGAVVCWGADDLGQTGDGDPGPPTTSPSPTVGRF